MGTLVTTLAELTGHLQPAGGVTAATLETLADLRRKIAAVLIFGDPGLVPVPDDPTADPLLQAAAKAGEALAKEWEANKVRNPRYVEEPYLAVELDPHRPTEVLGPFIGRDQALVQFAFRRSADFVVVRTVEANIALLPIGTAKDPNNAARWVVPGGSAWVGATRIVVGTRGWAGLRIASGLLEADGATLTDNVLLVDRTKPWTLTVTPEQPPAPVNGSDGDFVSIKLPTRLVVSSTGAATVSGPLELANFGTLAFTGPPTAAVKPANDEELRFPFPGNPNWALTSNRSGLFALRTAQPLRVSNAWWTLRLSGLVSDQLGEAAHGGALAFQVPGGLRSQVSGTIRDTLWRDTSVVCNARGIELRADKAQSDVTMELALWGESRTRLNVSDRTAEVALRLCSRTRGADLAAYARGRATNRWDRPRAASGTPFEFTGTLDALTLVAEDSGLRRVALRASRTPDGGVVNGYALENLFLRVSPARRIALVGSGTPNRLSEGQASVVFDVRSASPTLPRPYAANFSFDRFPAGEVVSALSAVVTWPDVRSPKVQSTLNATVPMPDPPVVGDGDRGMLYLLDVSGRDDRLGVALAPFEGVAPALEDNRLVWPMTAMALTMLPQVLWEPVQSIDTPLTSP